MYEERCPRKKRKGQKLLFYASISNLDCFLNIIQQVYKPLWTTSLHLRLLEDSSSCLLNIEETIPGLHPNM
jgi:hypothetical protein